MRDGDKIISRNVTSHGLSLTIQLTLSFLFKLNTLKVKAPFKNKKLGQFFFPIMVTFPQISLKSCKKKDYEKHEVFRYIKKLKMRIFIFSKFILYLILIELWK